MKSKKSIFGILLFALLVFALSADQKPFYDYGRGFGQSKQTFNYQ